MEKKKKKYVKPEMTVIKIDGKCGILAGSINKGTEFDSNWNDEVD